MPYYNIYLTLERANYDDNGGFTDENGFRTADPYSVVDEEFIASLIPNRAIAERMMAEIAFAATAKFGTQIWTAEYDDIIAEEEEE